MIKLLDCTLRDGGYYTNWDFDKNLVREYLNYIEKLPIKYIEIGYRSPLKKGYLGEYFYLHENTIDFIKKNTSKKLVIMLNAKDFENKKVDKYIYNLQKDIALVRIATDPDKIEQVLQLATDVKKLGFDVALNIMYISKIDKNHKIFNYFNEINKIASYIYLVDSYGAIYPEELEKLIKNIQQKTNLKLGFHGHNNLELAFSNTLAGIKNGIEYIDSTILGMGRGAGNLKTELILTYLKSKENLDFDLNDLSKLVELFTPLHKKYNWGTNLAYMVSGSYSLPQKDVMETLEIDRYSLGGIVNSLQKNVVKYNKFLSKGFKQVLIIGGGESVVNHLEIIKYFLNQNKDILLIHSTSKYIEYFNDIANIKYFAVAGDEILKIKNIDYIQKVIFAPSPRSVNIDIKNEKFCELNKIDFIKKYFDSPLAISLQISKEVNADDIYLVGFDGYSELKSKKELYLMYENQYIIDNFKIKLISLTDTKYKNIVKSSIYGVVK